MGFGNSFCKAYLAQIRWAHCSSGCFQKFQWRDRFIRFFAREYGLYYIFNQILNSRKSGTILAHQSESALGFLKNAASLVWFLGCDRESGLQDGSQGILNPQYSNAVRSLA